MMVEAAKQRVMASSGDCYAFFGHLQVPVALLAQLLPSATSGAWRWHEGRCYG